MFVGVSIILSAMLMDIIVWFFHEEIPFYLYFEKGSCNIITSSISNCTTLDKIPVGGTKVGRKFKRMSLEEREYIGILLAKGKASEALGKSWGGIILLSAGNSILMLRPFIRGITLPIRHMNAQ